MKNKDYVGQANKRKKPPRKEAPEPSRPFPLVRFAIVAILVAAFGYFLFHLSKQDDNVPQATKTPEQNSNQSQTELPPPPDDEEWQFIEELENKQVDVTKEELEDKGPFKMQCASFRSESDAEALKAQIAFAGFESQVRSSEGSSGTWYKVVLGPFDRKRDAEKTRHILKRNKINGCAIWLWR